MRNYRGGALVVPEWKRKALAAAARQNERQRKAAKPAHGGFGDCTSGASLSLINSYAGTGV